MKNIFYCVMSLVLGLAAGYIIFTRFLPLVLQNNQTLTHIMSPVSNTKEIIGFLPYWLITKADKDYTKYITTLNYFGLTVQEDGTIKKRDTPTETEPGWYSLISGRFDPFLEMAKQKNKRLAITAFSADENIISGLIASPTKHATNLIQEFKPVMKKYGFAELNLDIEATQASDEARTNFTAFVKEIRAQMDKEKLGYLTIDVSPTALIKKYLVDVPAIANYVDKIMFMTYDYHYNGSLVAGAVAPQTGAGVMAEFDTQSAIQLALSKIPPEKILVGTPLYGYEWETLSPNQNAATLPGSGVAASNRRIEELLHKCASCSAVFDSTSQESVLTYLDTETNTYHQFYYPDKKSVSAKTEMVKKYNLGGMGLWALGYEGNTILEPLTLLQ